MIFEKTKENNKLIYVLGEKLNPSSLMEFETDVKSSLDGIKDLILDFKNLEYISSSVIRLLIDLHLTLENQEGKMVILNPNEEVFEVIQMTGLDNTLNIQK